MTAPAPDRQPGPSRAEVCVVACAEAWRGDGAILASPMGLIPALGARLAQLTFAPGLLLTDGEAHLLAPDGADGAGRVTEGWLPYRSVFTMVAAGLRHVMMGAAQIDRFGNQNISCIGDWARPKAQLLGVRGAPGNTINHPVSYWVPRHSPPGLRRAGGHGLRHRLRPRGRPRPAGRPLPRAARGRDQPGGAGLPDNGPQHAAPLGPPGRRGRRRHRRHRLPAGRAGRGAGHPAAHRRRSWP